MTSAFGTLAYQPVPYAYFYYNDISLFESLGIDFLKALLTFGIYLDKIERIFKNYPCTLFSIFNNLMSRITAVDQFGRGFVEDVSKTDLWFFPGGIPHSIQGIGDDGCFFLLVFDDGNFDEFQTFMLTDWLRHTPREVVAKNFEVDESVFKNLPQHELYIFASELPRPLYEEKMYVAQVTGEVYPSYAFFTSLMEPNKTTRGNASDQVVKEGCRVGVFL